MSEPVAIGLVVAGAVLMVALLLAGIDASWRVYAKAASILGLAQDRSAIIGPAIKGTLRGWGVRIWEASSEPPRSKLSVTSPSQIPSHLCLRPARAASAVTKHVTGDRVITGDEEFDSAVWASGNRPEVLALLDQETRSSVSAQIRTGGAVQDVRLTLVSESRFTDGQALASWVERGVELADRLARDNPTEQLLATNARHDPVAGVRCRNLNELVQRFQDHPLTNEALFAALSDTSPEVRVLAASCLGEEGLTCLRALVDSCGTPESVAEEAVRALADRLPEAMTLARLEDAVSRGHDALATALLLRLGSFPSPAALAKLEEALAGPKPALACAAAASLGRAGGLEAERALLAALESTSADVRAAAAKALAQALVVRLGSSPTPTAVAELGQTLVGARPALACVAAASLGRAGGPAAERALLAALESTSADVRAAAARALGHAGSVAAIPALHKAASGNYESPAVWRSAAEAIAAIQGRVAGAAPGQLALADGEAGALAFAAAAAGTVSVDTGDLPAREEATTQAAESEGPGGARAPRGGLAHA